MFVGLFADNLGSFANNVGLSAFLFANNVVSKLRCLWVEAPMFAGCNSIGFENTLCSRGFSRDPDGCVPG